MGSIKIFKPLSTFFQPMLINLCNFDNFSSEKNLGIEPRATGWEASMLPLCYAVITLCDERDILKRQPHHLSSYRKSQDGPACIAASITDQWVNSADGISSVLHSLWSKIADYEMHDKRDKNVTHCLPGPE